MKKLLLVLLLLTQLGALFGQTEQDSLTIVNIDWKRTHIEQGIIHYEAQVPELYKGPQNINIIEIDFKSRRDIEAAIIADPKMEKTSQIAKNNMAKVALNGSYYNMKAGNSVCYYKQNGVVVDTTAITASDRANGVVRIKKGKVSLEPWDKEKELKDIKSNNNESVLAAGPMMLHKGNYLVIEENDFNRTKHPRTAIVTTKDNKLLFVTVDGRNKEKAIGVSIKELAQLLKLLNAKEALNLDGGGSTTLWSKRGIEDGVLNMPSDRGGERKVANVIVIKRK